MPCYRPVDAYQLEGGEIRFAERGKVLRALQLPCGRCIGCRAGRQRAWAIRCLHEAQMHPMPSSFITLTYNEENYAPSLNYPDFQKFMYRLRRRLGPTRFFMCGEYGETTVRPHFHALLFGRTFPEMQKIGDDLYRSPVLERLWPHGHSSIGAVTYQSAAYVAGYTLKKRTGPQAEYHYNHVDLRTGECLQVVPEFGHMSLKPGIGYTWFLKYWREVYGPRDGVVLQGGKTVPAPSYYDKLLERIDNEHFAFKQAERYKRSFEYAAQTTPERLAVREAVAISQSKLKRRSL